ncbi:hypothetical protein AB0M39_39465 [Streptomyces sp. NPDC051907]|uniref:hypothetical protein n=1 Tax=Streptomyces sp. NPDC051907 TaxID=3155284 RepID=UPI00342CC7FC
MITPLPDMHPGCTWADQPVTAPAEAPGHIGSAAVVEPATGLTVRYRVLAYDPIARTAVLAPDLREDRAGVVRLFPADQRSHARTVSLADLDDLRLVHRRTRDGLTALHADTQCRHVVKAAFTAGGDRGVPRHRRVYRFWMQTTQDNAYRFLVRAPSQEHAHALARTWWQGTATADGWRDGRLADGERISVLSCEGARDMPVWPYSEPVADPV